MTHLPTGRVRQASRQFLSRSECTGQLAYLLRLDRCERRALSRRKFAIRRFNAAAAIVLGKQSTRNQFWQNEAKIINVFKGYSEAGAHLRMIFALALYYWDCSLRGKASQLEPSFACSDGALAAGRSIGSLKYKHHFGLDCFSMRREHWALQASLTHSSNDDSFAASGLDASAFAVRALGRTGFVGGKICSVGATSATGFSRSKLPLSAHPERARARSVANTHFIFAPIMQCQTHPLHHATAAGEKG
jgi:hypothetical protein